MSKARGWVGRGRGTGKLQFTITETLAIQFQGFQFENPIDKRIE